MIARRIAVLAGLLGVAGCVTPARPPAPPRAEIRSLWDLAPADACAGIVARDHALGDLLELVTDLATGAARKELTAVAHTRAGDPLMVSADWASAGLDASQGAAAFSWPDASRGALLVLPVSDRPLFRAAFQARVRREGDREIDELESGYLCAPTAGRYLCARSVEILDTAAAPHEAPLARAVERLPAADRGAVELYVDPRLPALDKPQQQLEERASGKLAGVAAVINLRPDGASLRIHVLGTMDPAAAKGLAGGPPPPGLAPPAAGAPSLIRIHVDPAALLPLNKALDPKLRAELLEQLTGDAEITTSGSGLAGLSIIAPLKDSARAEAFLKALCAGTGGTMRRYLLDRITVREHGCTAVLDPSLLLLPVTMAPLKLSASIEGGRLVALGGDATEPAPELRSWDTLVEGAEAQQALTGTEALVGIARSLQLGPDVGAAASFRAMSSLFDDRAARALDAVNDVGSHIYQALVTARMEEGGGVATVDITTFAGDPPAARSAYDLALARRAAGDEAAYRAALAVIEQRYPGTRAARRAALVRAGGPSIGAGAILLSMLGGLSRRTR